MKCFFYCVIATLLFQTGCNLAPKYARPEMPMPADWRVDNDEASTLCNLDWWKQLEDPVLDELIFTALQNNKDIQIAAWRVAEYFANYQVALSSFFPQFSLGGSALKEKLGIDSDFLPPGISAITP